MPYIVRGVSRWLAKRRGLDYPGGGFGLFDRQPPGDGQRADYTSGSSPFCANCGAVKEEGAKACGACGKRY